MKITFFGMHESVDDATREYAEKKLNKLGKFFRKECDAKIALKKEHGRCRAEVSFEYDGIIFRAQEVANSFSSAIEASCATIERQIRKRKTKLDDRIHETITLPNEKNAPNETEENFEIVRRKAYSLKPMSEDEAILQMEMLHHSFYLYLDAETNRASVVYKREEGGYGVIEGNY